MRHNQEIPLLVSETSRGGRAHLPRHSSKASAWCHKQSHLTKCSLGCPCASGAVRTLHRDKTACWPTNPKHQPPLRDTGTHTGHVPVLASLLSGHQPRQCWAGFGRPKEESRSFSDPKLPRPHQHTGLTPPGAGGQHAHPG